MKNRIITLSLLILAFIIIALLVVNNNYFILGLDDVVQRWIANHQSPSIYNFMLSITNVGDILGTIIIFLVFGVFLFLKNKKNLYTFAVAATSGIVLTEVIKYLIQRARPYNLIEHDFSFPSAHTTVSAIFLLSSIYLIAPLMEKKFSKNIFLLITSIIFPLVAFSRIYLSVHFTSDVIAGIILGSICFLAAEIILKDYQKTI